MKKYLTIILLVVSVFFSSIIYADYCAIERADVQEYIDHLVKRYDFDRSRLQCLFSTVMFNDEVVTRLSRPAEAKPWYEYRTLLITPERIEKGLAYWQSHESILNQVEKKYGVPASIIVAIIGVETKYGENKGTYPVFNTLATLSFNNERRAAFFRSELTHYLLLTRENNLKPLLLKGSYAGAVGLPQFMPSSYRHYAVDFHNKGFADLFSNDADAIASVANYLNKHGWHKEEEVAIFATSAGDCSSLYRKGYKPQLSEADLKQGGVIPAESLQRHKTCLVRLQVENGYEHWLGLQNFYVISTYNNSELYVMAINTLAKKMRDRKYYLPKKPVTRAPCNDELELEKPVYL